MPRSCRCRAAAALSALLMALVLPRAIDAQQPLPPAVVEQIDAVFAGYDSRYSPGCAAAVVRDGRIVFEKGYGMADLQHDVPITPASIFHVASISKQFTAMAIVLLAEEGRLKLDDDIRTYLPEVPDLGHRITIRHLIHHTSGLRDQWQLLSLSGWRADDPKSGDDILWLVSRQRALNFPPGAEHLYSNTGYTLLGTIVSRVSGRTLREFADERIFQPLGMTQTHFHDDHTMIVPGRTSAYAARGGRGGRGGRRGGGAGGGAGGRDSGPRTIDDFRISIPVFDNAGATSLFTTVRDLARWDANFLQPVVGGARVLAQMAERGTLADGTSIPYAFALTHGRHRGLATIGHSGSDAGYRADFVRFPDERHAFVTLCNISSANAGQLNRRMAEAVLGDRMEPAPARSDGAADLPSPGDGGPRAAPIDAAMLPRLAGAYLDRTTETLREIVLRDEALHLGTGGNAPRLVHLGSLEFAVANDPEARWRFTPGAGDAPAASLIDVRRATTFERVGAPLASRERLAELAGRYRSEELDVEWTVAIGDDGALQLERRRLPAQRLRPVFEDGFAAGVGSLRFTRGAGGRVDGFLLTSGRVRHIRFARQ